MPIYMIVLFSTGYLSDKLHLHKILSLKTIRRIFQTLTLGLPTISFLVLGLIDLPLIPAIVTVTVAVASMGFTAGGKDANFLDLTPKYTASVFGLANMIGSFPGVIGVFLTGFILDETNDNWSIVFLFMAGLSMLGVVVWLIFLRTDPIDFDDEEEDYLLGVKEKSKSQYA